MAKKKHAGSGIVLSHEALTHARRVKHDMTQAQLAIAAGLDEKTIRRAESELPIDPSFAHMIAGALGVELSNLVKRDPTTSDPIADAIAKLLVAIVFSGDYPPPYKAAAVKRLTELVLFLGLKGFDAEQLSATAGSLIVTVPLSRRDTAKLMRAFIAGKLEHLDVVSITVSTSATASHTATIVSEADSYEALRRGVSKLASRVKVTLGRKNQRMIGHTALDVFANTHWANGYEQAGARMAAEVAKRTQEIADDGATTAVVLFEAIFNEGAKAVVAGANPFELTRGIKKAVASVIEELKKMRISITNTTEVHYIAMVAANYDADIGAAVATAIEQVRKDGVIIIEEGKSIETDLTVLSGFQFDSGYIDPVWVTNRTDSTCVLNNAYILIHERKLSTQEELIPLLVQVSRTENPLLVIAEEIEGKALANLLINSLRGTLNACAINVPGAGDRQRALLSDIATLTGGMFISEQSDIKIESLKLDQLGSARRIIVGKDNTVIIQGSGKQPDVEDQIQQVRSQIETTTSDSAKQIYQERLSRLTGRVAMIAVGGGSELEMNQKMVRARRAVRAIRTAFKEGLLPGGGIALLRASQSVRSAGLTKDEEIGYDIVVRACRAPLICIADNAGQDGLSICEKLINTAGYVGYNVATAVCEDMLSAGIYDLANVPRTALQAAAGTASFALTSEDVLSESPANVPDRVVDSDLLVDES